MKKIKVGIVDSGINEGAINSKVIHNKCTREKKDVIGHGTMCAKIIETFVNSELEFISVKIFQNRLQATERQLIDALTYLQQMNVDIINMSLSVDMIESSQIHRICNHITENGTVIISAASNSGQKTLLDNYTNIITVSGGSFYNNNTYWFDGMKAVCDIEPILIKCDINEYDFFGGNSKATALFTSIVINSWNENTQSFSVDKVKSNARKITWHDNDIYRSQDKSNDLFRDANSMIDSVELQIILNKIEKITGIKKENFIYENDWYTGKICLTANMVNKIVDCLNEINDKQRVVYMEYFRNFRSFVSTLSRI